LVKGKTMKRSDWLRERLAEEPDNYAPGHVRNKIKQLEKKCLKLQQERDNAMLLHADMELRFCQYILRTENEKAIAARLPHSRGLHPRVAALKGVHTEDGKEDKIKS
jgi:hypothetical protein